MCHPAAIALATVGAGLVTAGAQIQQGRAQAHIARENADLARFAARDALERGRIEEEELRRRGERFKGRQRAALAAQGVVLDTGSAVAILEDTAGEIEFGALKIRANAERESFGLESQADIFDFQADQFERFSGFAAGATILGSGASALATPGLRVPILGTQNQRRTN